MAYGFKSGGRKFKKGESGNPNGRPKLPRELRHCMNMNKIKFAELLVKYLDYSLEDLKKVKSEKETPSLDRIVISIILNAIKKGDEKRLDFLMNRIIGKSESKIDITTGGESLKSNNDLSKLSDKELFQFKKLMSKCNDGSKS